MLCAGRLNKIKKSLIIIFISDFFMKIIQKNYNRYVAEVGKEGYENTNLLLSTMV